MNTSGRQIISLSLTPSDIKKLERLRAREGKSRSQLVRELINRYEADELWERVFRIGRQTALKFGIKSEEDVLKIIQD